MTRWKIFREGVRWAFAYWRQAGRVTVPAPNVDASSRSCAWPALPQEGPKESGYDRLWLWFSISRASFLTLPRVLMHEMPDEWQGKMADLLEEYSATFTNWPDDMGSPHVLLRRRGRYVSTPRWLINYRHPDHNAIERLRPGSNPTPPEGAKPAAPSNPRKMQFTFLPWGKWPETKD